MSELYTKVAEQRGNDPHSVGGLGCIAYDNPSSPTPSGGCSIADKLSTTKYRRGVCQKRAYPLVKGCGVEPQCFGVGIMLFIWQFNAPTVKLPPHKRLPFRVRGARFYLRCPSLLENLMSGKER